jgi:cation transport ATPase
VRLEGIARKSAPEHDPPIGGDTGGADEIEELDRDGAAGTLGEQPVNLERADTGEQQDHEAPDHDGHDGHDGHEAHDGHGEHAGHGVAMFRNKFWLSLALTLPVVFWSDHIQELLGYTAPAFPGSEWIPAVLGTVVFFYGGLVFLQGGWRELKDRLPGMMTLISLAITVAFLFSVAVELGLVEATALWWELATLVAVMLLGHWVEMRSISQAQGALQELAKLLPDTATRVTDGETEEVSVEELSEGDLVLVRPGENVPVDGMIRKGEERAERGHDHRASRSPVIQGGRRRGHRRAPSTARARCGWR